MPCGTSFRAVKARADDLPLCAVVKADGYGHGAVQCARVLRRRVQHGWQ